MRKPVTTQQIERSASKNATATAGANTAVVITITAVADVIHVIRSIQFAFDATPTATANLTVVAGSTTIFQTKVTDSGPGPMDFPAGLHNDETPNEAVVITLAAGGAGVIGTLNVQYV